MTLSRVWLVLALSGCSDGLPDPRDSDVVVGDERLQEVTEAALTWWGEATDGAVHMHLAERCRLGVYCVVVRTGDVEENHGVTSRWYDSQGNAGAWITVAPVTNITLVALTHELGHVLRVSHVDDPTEVMRPSGNNPTACIGPETLAGYESVYGPCLKCLPTCRP